MRVLVVVLLCLLAMGSAVKFKIGGHRMECLREEASRGELIVGKASVAPSGPTGSFELSIVGPLKNIVLKRDLGDSEEKFAITAQDEGEHSFCFQNLEYADKIVEFSVDVGKTAKDYEAVARKENLKPIELELRKIEDVVGSILADMTFLKQREEAMRNTNESTNARVMWFSMFSVAILAGLGLWQIWYLRSYFRSRKMI